MTPVLMLVENGFSCRPPELLCGIDQPMTPSPGHGWFKRRKSRHFEAYNALAADFGAAFGIDPWLVSTYVQHCGLVDFRARVGLECVALNVEKMVYALREKYAEHGIEGDPYIYIKADSGTYGMGIMTAKSGADVYAMNKKTRHSMHVIKEGVHNTEVMIQEGVKQVPPTLRASPLKRGAAPHPPSLCST